MLHEFSALKSLTVLGNISYAVHPINQERIQDLVSIAIYFPIKKNPLSVFPICKDRLQHILHLISPHMHGNSTNFRQLKLFSPTTHTKAQWRLERRIKINRGSLDPFSFFEHNFFVICVAINDWQYSSKGHHFHFVNRVNLFISNLRHRVLL